MLVAVLVSMVIAMLISMVIAVLVSMVIAVLVSMVIAMLISMVVPVMTVGSFWFAMEWNAIQALVLCERRADMSPIADL